MLIVLEHQGPTLTQERYEVVISRLTGGTRRAAAMSDLPFPGLLMHVAWQSEDGFRIVDVWESEDALAHFDAVIRPIADAVGITDPPATYPAHTYLLAH
jgi:hypothetical protein